MSWQEKVAERVKQKEEEVENVLPRSYAARFKVFLDRFLPYSIILLFSLIGLHLLGGVNARTATAIRYLNWLLVSYFCLRLAMAFRLAESDTKFLKQHWFDALVVIPAFTLLQEVRALSLLGEVESEGAVTGITLSRNAGIASQITRIVKIVKRSLSF